MRDKELLKQTSEKYLSDLFAILSLNPELTSDDRLTLAHAQSDLPGVLSSATWKAYADLLQKYNGFYERAAQEELQTTKELQVSLLPQVVRALQDPDPEVIQAALMTLGQWGLNDAAETIRPFLGHDKAYVREGAATALAKLGRAGKRTLEKALKDSDERVRLTAAVGLKQR